MRGCSSTVEDSQIYLNFAGSKGDCHCTNYLQQAKQALAILTMGVHKKQLTVAIIGCGK